MDTEKHVVGYFVHDIIGNNEQWLENYDPEVLQAAEEAGLVFIAVYSDESREVVKAADIVKPSPYVNGVTLAATEYVDNRTDATIAVFDALAAIIDPESAVATADETGEVAVAEDPIEAFKKALAALKAFEATETAGTGGSDD